jgi:hypothetical protein
MSIEIRLGDYVVFREDRPAPDVRSLGLVGQVIDPGYKPPDPTKVYVRFPNGRESWMDRGSLLLSPIRQLDLAGRES